MKNHRLRKVLIVLFWLAVWQAAGMMIHDSIILVGPAQMAAALIVQLPTVEFWKTILYSFTRINLGLLLALVLGVLLGSIAYRSSFIRELLEPVMLLLKAVPVASFVILVLIWLGSKRLSIFSSFVVVLPVIYVNTLAGLQSTDKKLLEMAKVFRVSGWKRIFYIYRPALMPYLISSCKTALGMSWKSGVAAEVIGVPAGSIGEKLYMSKIYLNTADLFAWTFVVIIISALFESLVLYLLKRMEGGKKQYEHSNS